MLQPAPHARFAIAGEDLIVLDLAADRYVGMPGAALGGDAERSALCDRLHPQAIAALEEAGLLIEGCSPAADVLPVPALSNPARAGASKRPTLRDVFDLLLVLTATGWRIWRRCPCRKQELGRTTLRADDQDLGDALDGVVLTSGQGAAPLVAERVSAEPARPPLRPVEPDRGLAVTPTSIPAATPPDARRDTGADIGSDGAASFYGDFPFLHERSADEDRPPHPFAGLDPQLDAWLTTHARDPQDLARLRPLASRIMQDAATRDLVAQMTAEVIAEADRITQQARFQQSRGAAARQALLQR